MPDKEIISLPSGGSIPGIPGSHGPGTYEVDWAARTVRRVVDGVPVDEAQEPEADEEAAAPAPEQPPQPEPEPIHIEEQISVQPIPEPAAEPAPEETREAEPAAPEEGNE